MSRDTGNVPGFFFGENALDARANHAAATVSIREGIPSLMVINEDAVPSIYWQPSEPRLNRQELAYELKQGAEIAGVALTDPEPVLSVRTR